MIRSLSAGHQPSGDQIPWKFCELFQDEDFPSLSGARIVRIATHPDAKKVSCISTLLVYSIFYSQTAYYIKICIVEINDYHLIIL